MDLGNIVATMRYFEALGLQVLMASTGDALGILTAFLDRYYDILRDAEKNGSAGNFVFMVTICFIRLPPTVIRKTGFPLEIGIKQHFNCRSRTLGWRRNFCHVDKEFSQLCFLINAIGIVGVWHSRIFRLTKKKRTEKYKIAEKNNTI